MLRFLFMSCISLEYKFSGTFFLGQLRKRSTPIYSSLWDDQKPCPCIACLNYLIDEVSVLGWACNSRTFSKISISTYTPFSTDSPPAKRQNISQKGSDRKLTPKDLQNFLPSFLPPSPFFVLSVFASFTQMFVRSSRVHFLCCGLAVVKKVTFFYEIRGKENYFCQIIILHT